MIARVFCVATLIALHGSALAAGDVLDLNEYRGKVVVVDFWASWCVPCRRSFPWLNEMQEKYGDDGLIIVGVNVDKDQDDAREFLSEYRPVFKIVNDPDGVIAKQYDVIAMPSSYVIGKDGNVVDTHLGFKVRKQDDYEAVIRKTLDLM